MKQIVLYFGLLAVLCAQDVVQLEKKIYFEKNTYKLSREAKNYLDKLAPYLKKQKDLKKAKLKISGHTDTSGGETRNKNLSEKRACSVKDYLVKKHGIQASRLYCVGYGASMPVGDNNFEVGRKLNRRVVISKKRAVTGKELAVEYRYDKLGRVIEANYSNGHIIKFEYDAVGNILKRTDVNQ